MTVPVGLPSMNKNLQCFTPDEAETLLPDCSLVHSEFYKRDKPASWQPCSRTEISTVNNGPKHRGPMGGGGLNSVGCFVWTRN